MSRARRRARVLLSTAVLSSAALAHATPSAGAEAPLARAAGPPTPTRAWIAKVVYPTLARAAPRLTHVRRLFEVSPVSAWGAPTELLVLGSRVDAAGHPWLRVRLDYRPNGFAAWIDEEDTVLHEDPWRITVSRERREVRVYDAGRLVRSFAAVVGKPSTPTPAGLFAIAAELPQPSPSQNFEGAWVLPLTAHSEVLQHFEGGDGQVALHGRGGASLADPLGSARSHGCVRLANAAIGWIAGHVPVGTPVRVR
jgi:lipoprotein-anchoring transpeptidase ErfK/SrfK